MRNSIRAKLVVAFTGVLFFSAVSACPVCERANEKKIFGIAVHGTAPDSQWDYLIVYVIIIITILTLFYSIKWLIKPGEKSNAHIKHIILKFDEV